MTTARSAYRENDVRGATAVRLVVLLYEQLVQDLHQALDALEKNDIEMRTRRINHAILVIGHLQSPLDFANGGKVAQDLNKFYDVLRQNLMQVQFHPSKSGICQQITDVLTLREAWVEVERAEKPLVANPANAVSCNGPGRDSNSVRVNWKA